MINRRSFFKSVGAVIGFLSFGKLVSTAPAKVVTQTESPILAASILSYRNALSDGRIQITKQIKVTLRKGLNWNQYSLKMAAKYLPDDWLKTADGFYVERGSYSIDLHGRDIGYEQIEKELPQVQP